MRLILILFLVLSSSACTVKTLYNQLDWLLANHLGDYVELNNEQYKLLYRRIDSFFLWHKSTQLPLYVAWLQDFEKDVNQRPTVEAIDQNFEQFKILLRDLRAYAADEMLILVRELSPAQREELYRGMEKKNQEFADDFIHVSREEQLEQYTERTIDRFDEWLGSLTEQQEGIIKEKAAQIKSVATHVLQSRRNWQAELQGMLESGKDDRQLKEAMHDLFVNIEQRRSAEYQALSRRNQTLFVQLIVDVAVTMTEKQKQHLATRVTDYSASFNELANEARVKLASQQ